MKQQLKIAVIGVGHLGKHHVEHFCSIKNIVLVGVYDIDKVRAEKISDKYDITCFSTIDELLKRNIIIEIPISINLFIN